MADFYGGAVEVARRTMTLFFLVDTSGSMDGSKIGTLNSAVEEVIPEIRKLSGENAVFQRCPVDHLCAHGCK